LNCFQLPSIRSQFIYFLLVNIQPGADRPNTVTLSQRPCQTQTKIKSWT